MFSKTVLVFGKIRERKEVFKNAQYPWQLKSYFELVNAGFHEESQKIQKGIS